MIWLRVSVLNELKQRQNALESFSGPLNVNADIFFRVQEADISLCVLSLPDIMNDTIGGLQMQIPPSLAPLITPGTFFLLNKSDLASASIPEIQPFNSKAWIASLSTGQGMREFIDSFSRALQERCVSYCLAFLPC